MTVEKENFCVACAVPALAAAAAGTGGAAALATKENFEVSSVFTKWWFWLIVAASIVLGIALFRKKSKKSKKSKRR